MILKLLSMLSEVEIQPHGKMVYDPEVAATEGFQLLGTLSPDLQRLGTLLDQQRALWNTERRAFEERMKEVKESPSLSMKKKFSIVTEEMPERLKVLSDLEKSVIILEEIFNFEMMRELKCALTSDETTALLLVIFNGWEVAVKHVDVKEAETPRHLNTNGRRCTHDTHHFSGKRGEA